MANNKIATEYFMIFYLTSQIKNCKTAIILMWALMVKN